MCKKLLCVLALGLAATACDDGSSGDDGGGGGDGGGHQHETYRGTIVSGTESGILEVEVTAGEHSGGLLEQAAEGGAEGTITFDSGVVDLTGTFAGGVLTLSGGGYQLSGSLSGGAISGTFTGPNGSGTFTVQPTASGAVQVYCGTYSGADAGIWNLVEGSDGTLTGSYSGGGGSGNLNGSRSGDAVSLTFLGGTATGTIAGDAVTGTWTATSGGSGSFTGAVGNCP